MKRNYFATSTEVNAAEYVNRGGGAQALECRPRVYGCGSPVCPCRLVYLMSPSQCVGSNSIAKMRTAGGRHRNNFSCYEMGELL